MISVPTEKGKTMTELKAYVCWFDNDDEWGSFVVAARRGQAKAIFYREFNDCGEWNDIRCRKVKDIPDSILIAPQCLSLPDDPVLELLGLKYQQEVDDETI